MGASLGSLEEGEGGPQRQLVSRTSAAVLLTMQAVG